MPGLTSDEPRRVYKRSAHDGLVHQLYAYAKSTCLRSPQFTASAFIRLHSLHYIFALWFLLSSSSFSSPNLSRRRLDVYHTSTHGVALVRI